MKIALVTHRYPPDAIAGVERYTQMLGEQLARGGDAISIITRRPGTDGAEPRLEKELLENGIRVFRLSGGDGSRERFGTHHARLERLFESILVETAPDVLHVNHVLDHSPRIMEIARRLRTAVVLTLHDFYFACPRIILQKPDGSQCEGPRGGAECARTCYSGCTPDEANALKVRAMYFRRLLGVPQQVLCPSQYVANYFRRWQVYRERIFVVPNGIAAPAMQGPIMVQATSPQRPRAQLRLAFLGSVVRHKGVHVVLEALRLAKFEKVDLEISGPAEPHYVDELRRQARRIRGVRLLLRGSYAPGDLPERLANIDCVVAASQWAETFLLVAREAMVHGVPVVVTRLGALPEAVADGVNGFSFDHDQPGQLAAIFRRMVDEPALLPKLREGARATRPLLADGHAAMVRAHYRRAIIDLAKSPDVPADDSAELEFLYSAQAQPEAALVR